MDELSSVPLARVTLASYLDPSDVIHDGALLNPNTLPMKVDVDAGELHPVGGSHTVHQYGHTKSMESSLEFYFSNQFQGRNRLGMATAGKTSIEQVEISVYVRWLFSFCYGKEPGHAPSPLIVIWPKVLSAIMLVKSVDASYIRFARDLTPTAARVTMGYSELRVSFRGSDDMQTAGFDRMDPLLYSDTLGPTLNLRGGNK